MEVDDADEHELDGVLEALANPHRRALVHALGLQPCAISQFAKHRGLSLPALHKHVRILEDAGLVRRRKLGRTTYLTLQRGPLRRLQAWTAQFHPYWGHDDATFENYHDYLGSDPDAEAPKHTTTQEPT